MEQEKSLKPPQKFPFPFRPYDIQHEFMSALYSTLEEGKLGIFESPTGTGRSLSIICGSLCWLYDHLAREKNVLESQIQALQKEESQLEKEEDWISGQSQKLEAEREQRKLEERLKQITDQESEMKKMKERVKNKETNSKEQNEFNKKIQQKTDEDVSLDVLARPRQLPSLPIWTSRPCLDDKDLLLEDIEDQECDSDIDLDNYKVVEKNRGIQIIICSRTHSQLSQLVGEVVRSPYKDVRLVPIASRQSYCINSAVRKLNNLTLINEKCLNMGSKGRKTKIDSGTTVKKMKVSGSCPYTTAYQNIMQLREEALVTVHDVESLADKGRKTMACPYYATRAAVPDAQVLVVSYHTLLHEETRVACGVRLKGNVVIIDEAHNLLDTIAKVHSPQLSGHQLTHAYSQLVQYRDKYSKRLSTANVRSLEQFIFVVGRLIHMLGGKPGCPPNETSARVKHTKIYSSDKFIEESIGNLNLILLFWFAERSKLSEKLLGFTERYLPSVNIKHKPNPLTGVKAFLNEISTKNNTSEPVAASEPEERLSNCPIQPILAFLRALASPYGDGRVVCNMRSSVTRGTLKFLLLNPAEKGTHFADIVKQARSVVVAGGTMQPHSEFQEQLFKAAGADYKRITHFSCNHVIPADHILPIVLCSGPTGQPFDFTYENRYSSTVIDEFGRTLENLCNIVPGGVICFFSSYDYEEHVYSYLLNSGIIDKISSKKKVFREPRNPNQVDQVLSDFAATINIAKDNPQVKPNGALLFSVVGGKLSEELNFSDDLGRCVIVVGMPYPNIESPELQEKMSYLNETWGSNTGQEHYDNLCMKAVNQCIGRAVRHHADYATVVLLDKRYRHHSIQRLLPTWILDSLQVHKKIEPAIRTIARFFSARKSDNPYRKYSTAQYTEADSS